MSLAAYRRALKFCASRSASIWAARVLGVVQSAAILALAVVAALFLALLTTRGEVDRAAVAKLPAGTWVRPAWLEHANSSNVGLYPVVVRNARGDFPQYLGARGVALLLRIAPPTRTNAGALLFLMASALVGILCLAWIDAWRRSAVVAATSEGTAALRRQLHRQIYRLGQSALPTEGIEPTVELFTGEVERLRQGLLADLDHFPRAPVLAIGLFGFALGLAWAPTLTLVSLGALIGLILRPLTRSERRRAEEDAREAAAYLGLLQQDLGLVRTVRVFGMEAFDNQRFDEHLEGHRAAEDRRLRWTGPIGTSGRILIGAAIVLGLGALGAGVIEHPPRIGLAAAIALTGSLLLAVKTILDALEARRETRQAGRSALAIFHFLERSPELQQSIGAHFLAPLRDKISFENVTLAGPSGKTYLEGVTFEIPAKSRTAIMGRDEESKHALACLIPRLIDPKVGRVRADGMDLREVTLESLRAQVATVFQHDLVFSDSVFNNIGLGEPSHSLPRVTQVAKTAHAHNFIKDLPNGYDTIIGPSGHYLRIDEQYRVAIARALLHDPSILIVEEPPFSLDEDVKNLIDDTIMRLSTNRTLIFLPHRLSTIRSCSQVVVLHNGRIEAIGNPRSLQGESKIYRHLQYLEFNQFAAGELEAGQINV